MEMRIVFLFVIFIICNPLSAQRLTPPRSYQYDEEEDDDEPMENVEEDEEIDANRTEKGLFLGSPCEFICSRKLLHVYCNPVSGVCECKKEYPVKLGPSTGCAKPRRLGDQCYYRETCRYADQHSSCVQIHHNAICQCERGYHIVSLKKPSKRIFCAEDLEILKPDVSTLAGVLTGIAVLSGLICFVLKLFNQNRYPRPQRFGNANLPPPIFFSNDPALGMPLSIIGDPRSTMTASRATSQRSLTTASSASLRRTSGYRGHSSAMTWHAGSRRPSLASVHSTSSVRSFSQKRFDREREQKEEREMQKRFAKIASNVKAPPTPSPRSTDDLLPPLTEDKPVPLAIQEEENGGPSFSDSLPSTSHQYP